MADVFDKIDHLMSTDLGQYAAQGHGFLVYPKLEGELGPEMKFQGKDVICWSLNNYLGLANHPEVRKVDAEAAAEFGLANPMGSRLLTGHNAYHEEFEQKIAAFVKKEDAFLLNFGYQGVMSAIPALTDRKDVIVYDKLCHSCILDGMQLSMAKRFVFAHNNYEQLADRLKKAERITRETGGGVLVIVEGVYSMKGDHSDLEAIVKLKERFNFRLMVDDAHGFGVFGPQGEGLHVHFGVEDQVDLYFSTFAKSMASIGAFWAGDHKVIQFMRYNLRSQVYAKALPLPLTVGAIKRLEIIQNQPELRENMWRVTRRLQQGLQEAGLKLSSSSTPITAVVLEVPDTQVIGLLKDVRYNHGIYVSAITPPVIEKGYIILRMIPTALHTDEHVDRTVEVFKQVAQKLKAGEYAPVPA